MFHCPALGVSVLFESDRSAKYERSNEKASRQLAVPGSQPVPIKEPAVEPDRLRLRT
jgi:hypothetical protein